MKQLIPLSKQLRPWIKKPLAALPLGLRERVEQCILAPWDELSAAQRRKAALEWDLQNDPANQSAIQAGFDLVVEEDRLAAEIARWRALQTPTALDASRRDAKLEELQDAMARLKAQGDRLLGKKRGARDQGDGADGKGPRRTGPGAGYIAYPLAMKRLTEALKATPEELAAWVTIGPGAGGLAAYLNANELDPPPRFNYSVNAAAEHGLHDYVAPLMACWFKTQDLDGFSPKKRFITGKQLIDRWAQMPGSKPKDFIRAKIRESRLEDLHPLWGLTQASEDDPSFPPLEDGLFDLETIVAVEAADFGESPRASGELDLSATLLPVDTARAKPAPTKRAPVKRAPPKQESRQQEESPAERALRLLARKEQLRKKDKKNFNQVIASEERISVSRVKQIISKAAKRGTVQQTEKSKR